MPDRLLDHLMEDHSTIDPTYVEDYLLTYVIFNNKAHDLVGKMLKWFGRGQLKDKVYFSSEIFKHIFRTHTFVGSGRGAKKTG